MKCKQCGWDNPDNFERCEKCGNLLFRQRPFETPTAYDDPRAANSLASNDYGNVSDNVNYPYGGQGYADPSYGGQPYRGESNGRQPYGGQPYNPQPYNGQPYGGGSVVGQPYSPQPYNGQPYSGQPYGDESNSGQHNGSRPYDKLAYCNDGQVQQPASAPDSRPDYVYPHTPYAPAPTSSRPEPKTPAVSYCPECDAELPVGATECPMCHAVIRQEAIEVIYSVCPECGTEVTPIQKFCQNCGAPLKGATAIDAAHVADSPVSGIDLDKSADSDKSEDIAQPEMPNAKRDDDTVAGGPLAEVIPECRLQMVGGGDTESIGRVVVCVGESVELYRDNTDPANNTIARDLQARLTFADGRWSIEDCSALRTTYIHPGRKIELCDGDVIVMGNREFIFKL